MKEINNGKEFLKALGELEKQIRREERKANMRPGDCQQMTRQDEKQREMKKTV